MGQSVDQIEDRIESSRQGLRSNLEELGDRVKSAMDWRETFRRHPGTTLTAAAVSGVILALAVQGRRRAAGTRRTARHLEFSVELTRRLDGLE